MKKIVECVPNFSEGRDLDKVERIISTFRNKKNVLLVNYEPDADYNRTVVTLLADPDIIIDVLMEFTKKVINEIDLNIHSGEHPRMGAVDVIPFIPIENVTMKECIELANEMGRRISEEFQIPAFLYAEAAKKEDRILLPTIRKGEFEGMKTKIKEDAWAPDYGKSEIHPTFGVVGIGARYPLIAYNIDLKTEDEKIANSIAKAIRKSSGGFAYIQAGPAYLEQKHHVQVTMNILDYKKNPIYRIFEVVKMEASRYHIEVLSAEIVGLLPKDALLKSLQYYFEVNKLSFDKNMSLSEIVSYSIRFLKLRDFNESKIIESFR
ncbi:MAG: glutamate formimidoyltransferase [Firmicutes bacterium]|nr:glutamate formimidoyltransferase [Bacillota bacterium]